jgi:DNA-binding NarL/FixJ family response regulator
VQRSRELAVLCESPLTPALVHTDTVTPLSAREREVAMLVAKGESNKAISAQLYLSVRTVENHVQRVLMKLGVTRRSDVAAALGLAPGEAGRGAR